MKIFYDHFFNEQNQMLMRAMPFIAFNKREILENKVQSSPLSSTEAQLTGGLVGNEVDNRSTSAFGILKKFINKNGFKRIRMLPLA